MIRYIVENPVRARLVDTPADYEFWGSSQYSREVILEGLQMYAPPAWRPGDRQA